MSVNCQYIIAKGSLKMLLPLFRLPQPPTLPHTKKQPENAQRHVFRLPHYPLANQQLLLIFHFLEIRVHHIIVLLA